MRIILLYLIALVIAPNTAGSIEVTRGKLLQGSLLLLQVDTSSTVTVNGETIPVSANGKAIVGFHRDETEPLHIIETLKDGSKKELTLKPKLRVYREQRINGLPENMVTPPDKVLKRIVEDRKQVTKARSYSTSINAFEKIFSWPIKGIITGTYGTKRILNGKPRAPHYGIDIAAPKGTPVRAPQAGIIRMAKNLYFTGWTIILDHGHGLSSTFLHLSGTKTKVGQRVQKNQIIGNVGSTGRSTGPHLDWRINLLKKRLDPQLIAGTMSRK